MEEIKKHYENLFQKHGDSPHAVQYASVDSQYKRFKVLAEIDLGMKSLVDVGCGLGDLRDYINKELALTQSNYLGLDFVQSFVDHANTKFEADELSSFKQFDMFKDSYPNDYDYYLLSGVFNNKFEGNEKFLYDSITKMFTAANKGIAFNAMSTYVDYFDENLFYINPLEVFDFCKKNLSKKVVLRHDYLVKENSIPFEFCIYVYK